MFIPVRNVTTSLFCLFGFLSTRCCQAVKDQPAFVPLRGNHLQCVSAGSLGYHCSIPAPTPTPSHQETSLIFLLSVKASVAFLTPVFSEGFLTPSDRHPQLLWAPLRQQPDSLPCSHPKTQACIHARTAHPSPSSFPLPHDWNKTPALLPQVGYQQC